MKKYIIAVLALFAILVFVHHRRAATGAAGGGEGQRSRAVPVTVATVVQESVPVELRTFGTAQAHSTVAIKAQIDGLLTSVPIQEGQNVKEGDLLAVVDPRPQQAALKAAEANLAKDVAQLKNAETEAKRQEDLLKKGMAAQDAFDLAQASAESLAAVVQADEAGVANAQLQLEYCEIRAPIAGRSGELRIHQGNVVKANDATLLTINQIVPIQVSFALPQQQLPAIITEMANRPLTVRAFAPGDAAHSETGELVFVDNQVDPATGTIRLKATFPNADQRLWPGQFVNVVLTLSVQQDAIVVPTPAIQTGQKGTYVFVVRPSQTVEDRPVVVNRAMNGNTIVSQGLKAGEQVVTDGQLRLTPGALIEVKPTGNASKTNGS
jgi:membrane fusion protein, multidrug efflux system